MDKSTCFSSLRYSSKVIFLAPTSQGFLDRKFTKQNVLWSLDGTQFPIIHFATHGQFTLKLSDPFLLTWARSGARSTLATLWSVNDNSTADLMTEFYRSLFDR
ncbi:MAG: CHAT domain-containing protein [Leptolyngbya sp. Prado105]|nr:CHAT domain-containing protein [Leptolyngbya sp. Prado105]